MVSTAVRAVKVVLCSAASLTRIIWCGFCDEEQMAVLKIGEDVVYHGYWQEDGDSVICVEDAPGEQIGVVRHLPRRSPTGMNWGYAGSGPSDAARSLLIAALGDDAVCPVCRGGPGESLMSVTDGNSWRSPSTPIGTHGPGGDGSANATTGTGPCLIRLSWTSLSSAGAGSG
jgi:hypothetical protein